MSENNGWKLEKSGVSAQMKGVEVKVWEKNGKIALGVCRISQSTGENGERQHGFLEEYGYVKDTDV